MNIFRSIIVFIVLLSAVSCDAPKLNPLDPANPDSRLGQFYGYVKTALLPQQPIVGVKVSWKNDNRLIETDAAGYYNLENLPIADGTLYFDKDGYSKDSIRVNWQNNKSIDLGTILLNAIPKLNNLIIYTCVENRYQDDQKDTLNVKANITDAENDIESVSVRCTALSFNKQLTFNPKSNLYELNYFYGTKNSVSPLDDAIGKNFEIIVKDHLGRIFNIGFSTIKRVIRQEISFESPANGVTVGSNPVLRWIRFLPGFNFQYMIQIYTREANPQSVWTSQYIFKDDIEVIPDRKLSAGDYYWVIWVIDDFQNRAQSKQASFTVQ